MRVFVAQNGRTLDVDAQPSLGVAALQNMLVPLCEIPAADQILILSGKPLDAKKPLSAYGLPAAGGAGAEGVFLYSKALMRQNAPMPALEVLTPVTINATRLEQVPYEPHMLDAAPSPLISALPQYERSFLDHLSIGQAYHRAMQERLSEAARLAQEMAVQAAAIEAARSNVEHHYSYICTHFKEFTTWFQGQAQSHAEVLGRFERDLRLLSSINILPAAQTQQYKCLADLVPEEQYSDWAAKCSATHENLVKRVGEVDSMFQALRTEVEALFMTGPSVSLEAVSTELQNTHAHVANEECVLQVLQRDCTQVQRLVEEAVRQLSAPMSSSSATPLDNCQLMEAMNDNHIAQLLPRLKACDDSVAAFCQRCMDSKNQMTVDVVSHLRSISGQQSKIRGLRQKLQILREATAKQDTAVSHLLFVRRVPAVYRQCLAECMRRAAFGELFAGQAGQLAERMGRLRQKETTKREGFLKHAEGYVPRPLLGALGLLGQPAHCQISVPATEPGLLTVTLEDIQNVPISAEVPDASRSSLMMGASQQQPSTPTSARAGDPSASAAFASPLQIPEGDGEGEVEGEAEAGGSTPRSLEMENARLRAEVATQYAHEAARSLLGGDASHMAASMQRSLQIGETQASPSTDQAAVARFRAGLAAREEVEANLESELAAARAQAASYEHRIRQLEGRLLRSAMRTSPSASMRGSGRSSSSPSSSFSGSGHLAPVTEAAEMRPVRRSLRESQHAAKDSAAAAVSAPQTGIPPDAVKEAAASLSGSTQTANPQAPLGNAAATSQARKEQDALRDAVTIQAGSQASSAQAEDTDDRRALAKPMEGTSTSGQDRQPVVRGSSGDAEVLADQVLPSSESAIGVRESSIPGIGSGQMQGSATGSAQPADSSQTTQGQGLSRTVFEEAQIASGAGLAGEKELHAGQGQLPQLQNLGGQTGASEVQGYAAALVDTSLQQLTQGQATGEPDRPAATRTAAEPRPAGAARLGTPFAAAAGTLSSSPGKESSLAAQASDSASPATSALPFAGSTAISGLSAMPSLAPHDPPQLAMPASAALDTAAQGGEAYGDTAHDPAAAAGPSPAPSVSAGTSPEKAAGVPEVPSIPLEASTAAGACLAPKPDDLAASKPAHAEGSG